MFEIKIRQQLTGVVSKVFIALFALVLFSGCSPINQLVRFDTVGQVYSSDQLLKVPDDASRNAIKSVTYSVPYADVFRVVDVSATQALFDVDSSNEDEGKILATRETKGLLGEDSIQIFFHAIVVEEKGPRETKVTVLSKVQSSCYKFSGGTRTFYAISTFGLSELLTAIGGELNCDDHIKVHWVNSDRYSTRKEVNQLFTIIRNNLIARGLM
ncbi:hypothetical protein MNBD_GAMMA09-167 [hydrothermal vent metagenome]|uniref:Lipoprotein n=1 Tax=hydrothermal vent metagenome TaxID=652676 RepID=A0A3B0XWL5_9ZZZZ